MKDLEISKELIKAVLEKETEPLSKDFNFTIGEDYIEFSDDGEMQFEYCIYKFAFKCKEWLENKVSNLCSGFDNGHRSFCHIENPNTEDRFYEDSEVEAIIKACEWILSEVSK